MSKKEKEFLAIQEQIIECRNIDDIAKLLYVSKFLRKKLDNQSEKRLRKIEKIINNKP